MNVSKLVDLALKQLGVLASGENAKANEVADAVDSLRGLLAQWATDRLYVYKVLPITLNLTGKGEYTLSQTVDSISDIAKLDDCEIKLIRDLNDTGIYVKVRYTEELPYWKFNVLCDAKKLVIKAFTLPTTLDAQDEIELPIKYERALVLSLALEIAPMFGVDPSMLLIKNQSSAIDLLKRSNSTPTYAKNDLPVGVCQRWRYGRYY